MVTRDGYPTNLHFQLGDFVRQVVPFRFVTVPFGTFILSISRYHDGYKQESTYSISALIRVLSFEALKFSLQLEHLFLLLNKPLDEAVYLQVDILRAIRNLVRCTIPHGRLSLTIWYVEWRG
jgi:hypothetical protein